MKESVNDFPLAQIPMSRKKKIDSTSNGIAKNVKKSKSQVDANKRQETRDETNTAGNILDSTFLLNQWNAWHFI